MLSTAFGPAHPSVIAPSRASEMRRAPCLGCPQRDVIFELRQLRRLHSHFISKKPIQRNFQRVSVLFKRSNRRDGVAIFHAGCVAANETCFSMSPWLRFLASRSSRSFAPISIEEDYTSGVRWESCCTNTESIKPTRRASSWRAVQRTRRRDCARLPLKPCGNTPRLSGRRPAFRRSARSCTE